MPAHGDGPAIVPAGSLSDEHLIATFNEAYRDYAVPVRIDATTWQALRRRFDVSLEASRALADGGGLALLGLRGERGWVAGMGVVPAQRRRGLGRALMAALIDQARARGVRTLMLEVLEDNARAIALYRAFGFRETRRLDVLLLELPLPGPAARDMDAGDAQRWIAERRTAPEPWQRDDPSLPRWAAPLAPLTGLEVRERGERTGAAVIVAGGGRSVLLQAHAAGESPSATAHALLVAARARGESLRYLNVPEGDPVGAAMRAAGARIEARQWEMALALA